MSDHEKSTPRVAIKFGAAAPSSGKNSKHHSHGRPKPTSSLGKRHRAHALQADSDSGSDSDGQSAEGRHEAISDYGPGGAVLDRKRRHRSRSPSSENDRSRHSERDSRSRRGARGSGREGTSDRNGSLKEVDPADADKPIKWGLTINHKPKRSDEDRQTSAEDDTRRENGSTDRDSGRKSPRNADEEAMEALLSSDRKDPRRPDASAADDRDPLPEDYKSVPVEDFGAALLRGFGWDGKMRGKVKEVTKHSNLVGLGAKNLKGAEDLDAWTQKSGSNKENTRKSRHTRLDDYRREEEKKRQRRHEKYGDGYKREKEREREHGRDRDRDRDTHRDRGRG